MIISPKTQLLGVKPEVMPGLICAALYFSREHRTVTFTNCANGAHQPSSLHYAGFAFDLDIQGASEEEMLDYESDLAEILGREYVVQFQGTHLHIHWSPIAGVNRT